MVLDSPDVYGFEWVDSVILNAHNYGFWISDATSFSIMGSTFATWGKEEIRRRHVRGNHNCGRDHGWCRTHEFSHYREHIFQ